MIIIAVFSKRPLFTACIFFMLSAVIGYNIPRAAKIILIIAFSLLFALYLIFGLVKLIKAYTSLCVCLCSAMIAIAMLSSYLYFDVKQYEYMQYCGNQCTIEGIVIETRNDGVNTDNYIVSVSKINGEKNSHKAILNCQFDAAMQTGTLFAANVSADVIEEYDGFGRYNEIVSLLSDGMFISYTLNESSSLAVVADNVFDIRVWLADLNAKLSNIIRFGIGGDEGGLAAALLLGNRSLLTDEISRDFTRAGVSHILALSGTHMTIIMGALMLLLKKLRVKRPIIAVILSFCSIFYLALIGFSVSATRSVIMLLFVYIAILLSDAPDSLTSLGIAGFLILLFSPGAVVSASFWMSFAATLGIVVYMPAFNDFADKLLQSYERFRFILRPLIYAAATIAASIFATVPLIIVLCIFIKEISLFSIISTVVLAVPSTLIIVLSLVYLPFSRVAFIGNLIGNLIRLLSDFTIDYCADISDLSRVVISVNYSFTAVFAILIGLALAYSLIFKTKNLFISLTPFVIMAMLFFSAIGIYEYTLKDNIKVSYLNSSPNEEMLVASNNREAVICDLSGGSNGAYYEALDELYDARVTEIRAIILTRYSNLYNSSFNNLFGSEKVRELWLPKPKTADEYYRMVVVKSKADEFGVDVYLYDDGEKLSLFQYTSLELYRSYIERSAVAVTLLSLSTRNDRVTYLSPAFNESELLDLANQFTVKSKYVIFGRKGPKTKEMYSIPENNKTDVVVFADELRVAYYDTENSYFRSHFLADKRFVINIPK